MILLNNLVDKRKVGIREKTNVQRYTVTNQEGHVTDSIKGQHEVKVCQDLDICITQWLERIDPYLDKTENILSRHHIDTRWQISHNNCLMSYQETAGHFQPI